MHTTAERRTVPKALRYPHVAAAGDGAVADRAGQSEDGAAMHARVRSHDRDAAREENERAHNSDAREPNSARCPSLSQLSGTRAEQARAVPSAFRVRMRSASYNRRTHNSGGL